MNLAELKEAYKARKLALDSAKKEEEKYKALLKDAMLEAGESDYTDEAGYRFERIVQERKSMDEEKLLAELHERTQLHRHRSMVTVPRLIPQLTLTLLEQVQILLLRQRQRRRLEQNSRKSMKRWQISE